MRPRGIRHGLKETLPYIGVIQQPFDFKRPQLGLLILVFVHAGANFRLPVSAYVFQAHHIGVEPLVAIRPVPVRGTLFINALWIYSVLVPQVSRQFRIQLGFADARPCAGGLSCWVLSGSDFFLLRERREIEATRTVLRVLNRGVGMGSEAGIDFPSELIE